jgi:hypothetical protein
MNLEQIYKRETGKEATFLEKGRAGLIYSSFYVEWLEQKIERSRTVRANEHEGQGLPMAAIPAPRFRHPIY